jgi:hypothetical protein
VRPLLPHGGVGLHAPATTTITTTIAPANPTTTPATLARTCSCLYRLCRLCSLCPLSSVSSVSSEECPAVWCLLLHQLLPGACDSVVALQGARDAQGVRGVPLRGIGSRGRGLEEDSVRERLEGEEGVVGVGVEGE